MVVDLEKRGLLKAKKNRGLPPICPKGNGYSSSLSIKGYSAVLFTDFPQFFNPANIKNSFEI